MGPISSPKFAIVLLLLLIIRTCKTTTTTLAKNGYFHPGTAPGASNYYASSVATVWVIAAQDCLAILGENGTLLNIETQVESDWISEWLDSRGAMVGRYWTSGSATGVGQEWYWTGNQGVDFSAYTNWGVGQPDSSNSRRRLALNYVSQSPSSWMSQDDSIILRYICESPAEDISTTTPPPTTTFKPGRGPYSFDYLLGVTTFVETGGDFVFIDYDLPLNVIWQYRAAGKTVMCHVDVGLWEMWRPDADNFPSRALGNVAWPGERWLDIRNTDVILPLMRERFRSAAAKGCHGIDADNMNAWLEDSGFPITEEEQLEYNIYIGQEIKVLGMLAGLKNAHQQAFSLLPYFDLVAVLECAAYNECDYFDVFISENKPVFSIEFTGEYTESTFIKDVCPLGEISGVSFILKNFDMDENFRVACV